MIRGQTSQNRAYQVGGGVRDRPASGPLSFGVLAGLSFAFSASFLFVVLSWPQYFFFSPLEAANAFSVFLLFLYLLSWPIFIFAPPIAGALRMRKPAARAIGHSIVFCTGLLFWPLVTLLIKIENLTRGVFSVAYWASSPSFILFEIIWPLVGTVLWIVLGVSYRRQKYLPSQGRQDATHSDSREGGGLPV